MRARRLSPLASAVPVLLAGALLGLPACYNLTKVPPPPRWVDDFSAMTPTWNAFSAWGCGPYVVEQPPTNRDGGADARPSADARPATDAGPDADAAAPMLPLCPFGPGDDFHYAGDTRGIYQRFDLPGGTTDVGIVAQSDVTMGPVDFTGFKQLVFSAKVESTFPASNPLPGTTQLIARLVCAADRNDKAASQIISSFRVDGATWTEVHANLTMFDVTGMSLSQACLSVVDSIQFIVVPGPNEAQTISGTLSLDNVQLEN
ncbi:MAG TPA: hypothetical protein VKZ18_24700 [Polyangia bacterium]|nr:hypothetical protein [Polyangia bacterium]